MEDLLDPSDAARMCSSMIEVGKLFGFLMKRKQNPEVRKITRILLSPLKRNKYQGKRSLLMREAPGLVRYLGLCDLSSSILYVARKAFSEEGVDDVIKSAEEEPGFKRK